MSADGKAKQAADEGSTLRDKDVVACNYPRRTAAPEPVAQRNGRLVETTEALAKRGAVEPVDAIGLGRNAMRALPTDAQFQVRLDALESAIAEDKAHGIRPMCIVGVFGTTNTGAVDPIRELRAICDREGMWGVL